MIEPYPFTTHRGRVFEEILNHRGWYLNAIINTPNKILEPASSLQPLMIIISKFYSESVYISELESLLDADMVFKSFRNSLDGKSLLIGDLVKSGEFQGFEKINILRELEDIARQYSILPNYSLIDLYHKIISGRTDSDFADIDNSIYFPRIGDFPIENNLSYIKSSQKNYYQVQLDETVDSSFLIYLYRTKWGKLAVESIKKNGVVKHISRQDLEKLPVYFPNTRQEQKFKTAQLVRNSIKDVIRDMDEKLNNNFSNSDEVLNRLFPVISVIEKSSEEKRVLSLIHDDESESVEFKVALFRNPHTKNKCKKTKDEVLSSIVAFANTNGGRLIIGVDKNRAVVGLQEEMDFTKENPYDDFMLRLKNLIMDRIGFEVFKFISYKIVIVLDKPVCLVECIESRIPIFLDENRFFIRANPARQELTGTKKDKYIEYHFQK